MEQVIELQLLSCYHNHHVPRFQLESLLLNLNVTRIDC
jgi:hypothetical protein